MDDGNGDINPYSELIVNSTEKFTNDSDGAVVNIK